NGGRMMSEPYEAPLDRELLSSIIRRYENALFLVNRRVTLMLRRAIGEEITGDQYSAMSYLRKHGRSTSSELAEAFCVGKSSITAIMTRLFDKQLIERQPDEQ